MLFYPKGMKVYLVPLFYLENHEEKIILEASDLGKILKGAGVHS